jgi:hypothetical protein
LLEFRGETLDPLVAWDTGRLSRARRG